MTRVAIIPARGGSTRIRHKNIFHFHGRPIIEYSIETAKMADLFDQGVYVSTEDPDIAGIARRAGAKVHTRQVELAANEVGTQQVMREALAQLFPSEPGRPDIACCIYATAPLMLVADLKRGLEMLKEGSTPYVFPVGSDGVDAGQWYWGLVSAFLAGVPLNHPGTKRLQMVADRVCDINTHEDWERAERLYTNLFGRASTKTR